MRSVAERRGRRYCWIGNGVLLFWALVASGCHRESRRHDGDDGGESSHARAGNFRVDSGRPSRAGVVTEGDMRSLSRNTQSSDIDGDGLALLKDNCPAVWNPTQRDDDGDGFGNACTILAFTLETSEKVVRSGDSIRATITIAEKVP